MRYRGFVRKNALVGYNITSLEKEKRCEGLGLDTDVAFVPRINDAKIPTQQGQQSHSV